MNMTDTTFHKWAKNLAMVPVLALSIAACQTTGPANTAAVQTTWPAKPADPRFYFEKVIHSSRDVVELTTAQKLRAMATGASGASDSLSKPFGVEIRNGRIFVGDSVSRLVHAFDTKAKRHFEIGTEGVGSLAKPLGIALDDKGQLYVVDATAKRVVIYDFDGNYINSIDGREIFERPTGIAVSGDGSKVFIVDTGGVTSNKHRVIVMAPSGKHLYDIGKRGDKAGEFNLPLTATIGPDGTLYVVDGGNFRVQAFDQSGKYKFSIGTVGTRSGQFARPKSVAVDAQNNIYVTDAAFGNIQIFNPKGELLMWIGERSTINGPGKFMLPSGLTVDRTDGRIYVVDQFFSKLEVYRPASLGKPKLSS